jgi:biopolymer transport protein ExbD
MISLKKKTQIEEVSAASMSDIAFLLLVFFMVTAVFFVKEGLNVQLPRKQASPTKVERAHVFEIVLTGDKVTISNQAIGRKEYSSPKEFRNELNKMEIANMPIKLALIKTSHETKYGNMLDVLSSVQLRGFEKISVRKKK